MTQQTQRYIIRNITQVFMAYICPLKVTFRTFWFAFTSTMGTKFSFPESLFYPFMLRSVASFISTPVVIIFRTIIQAVTFFRAVFNWSIIESARMKFKQFIASSTFKSFTFSSEKTATFNGTSFNSLNSTWRKIKSLITNNTISLNWHRVKFISNRLILAERFIFVK